MFLSDQEKAQITQFLQKIDFLKGLPEFELFELVGSVEKFSYQKGQTIIFQGEISHRLYLIFAGKVAVMAKVQNERKKVAELGEGEYFGEISLLEPTTASATLKAEESCQLYAISRDDFMSVAAKVPGALDAMKAKIMARKESLAKSKQPEEEEPQ